MKKYINIISIFILTIILTGCVRYNTTVEVSKNKSVNFEMIMAFDSEMLSSEEVGDYNLNEEDKKEFTDKGFTVDNYTDGNYKGYKISRKFKNIDTISSENDVKFALEDDISNDDSKVQMFKVKKGFLKNTYTLKLDANNEMTSNSEMADYLGSMDLKFTLKLPKKAVSNNATTVNKGGKELVWDLSKGTNVEAEFEIYNTSFYILIGGIVLVVILVVFIVLKNKKKGGNATIPNAVNNMVDNNMNQMNSSIQNNVNPMPVDNSMNQMNPSIQNNVNPMPIDNSMNQMNPSIQNNVNPVAVDSSMNQMNPSIQNNVNSMPVDSSMDQMNPNSQPSMNPTDSNNIFNNPNNGAF